MTLGPRLWTEVAPIKPVLPQLSWMWPHIHVVGAYCAIVAGNLALMVAGVAASSGWAAGWYRGCSVAIGLFGLFCGLALVLTRGWPPGLLERGAVDTVTAWEVGTGLLLALRLRRRPDGEARLQPA